VRQWVLSLPIPLRLLLAAQPELVTPVLQVVQRVVTRHLLGQAGLKTDEGHGGAPNVGNARRLTAEAISLCGGSWPGPGFPGDRRKLTLAGGAIAPTVRFLAPPRTHTGGQEPSLTIDGCMATQQHHRRWLGSGFKSFAGLIQANAQNASLPLYKLTRQRETPTHD
jgi:hypothetical protein